MTLFLMGQRVRLSNRPEMIFEIVGINPDNSYQIQYNCSAKNAINFNNISAEMLRLVDGKPRLDSLLTQP